MKSLFLRAPRWCAVATAFLLPVFATADSSLPVQADEFVCARQDFGETRENVSVCGEPLKIAGKTFARGIGACATSMIPLTVPAGTQTFSGLVGVDDCVALSGEKFGPVAEFRILSGTETLWSSGKIQRGEKAKNFCVSVPAGATKLYLHAVPAPGVFPRSVPADWVDLAWSETAAAVPAEPSQKSVPAVFYGADFGICPDIELDQGGAFRRALDALRARGGGVLELKKGTYHFYASEAHAMSFWISNHDPRETQPIALPLVDLRNATIRGNGSKFVFHGLCLPVLFMDCENVALDGVRIDLGRPFYSEARVLGYEQGKTIVSIDEKIFPYAVKNGQLRFFGDGAPERGTTSVIAFRAGTKNIVANTSDIIFDGSAEKLSDGHIALLRDFRREGDGVAVGDTLLLRVWERPYPACLLYRAKNTTLRDVSLHSGYGLALFAQRSENIFVAGTQTAEAKTSGSFPLDGSGRIGSSSADATHFSNVAGKIVVENSFFETMMDDAINVHSTCLAIEDVPAPDTLKCRYRHGQSIGFEVFRRGETLRFIAGTTLENGATATVRDVRRVSPTEVVIRLSAPVPAGVKRGDAVENADFQPEVVFRNNVVQNNRARGALFTTPKKVLVENNVFRNVSGSAILLAGDAQGWFESGGCEDVVIRNNVFENNLTSRFQFTNAIVSIYPEVRELAAQKQFYHHNVLIEENEFRTFDVPLLFAISAEKIRFEKNRIFYNEDFTGWGEKPFQFRRCAEISIRGNAVAPVGEARLSPQAWTTDDCALELTPREEISLGE